jgi:hypothetical protein
VNKGTKMITTNLGNPLPVEHELQYAVWALRDAVKRLREAHVAILRHNGTVIDAYAQAICVARLDADALVQSVEALHAQAAKMAEAYLSYEPAANVGQAAKSISFANVPK